MKFKNCFMSLPRKRGNLILAKGYPRPLGDVALVPGEISLAALVAAQLSESSARAGGIVVTPHASGSRLAVR